MRWLLWSVLAMAVVLGLSAFSDLTVVRDGSILVIASLPPVAMTIGIVRPQVVSVDDLLNATVVFALLSVVLVAVDLAVVAGARPGCSATSLRPAPGRARRAAADRAALRAAPAAALRAGAPAGARRPGPTPTTSSPAWPRPSSTPTRAPSSSPRSPTRSRSAFGVGYVRVEVDRSRRRAAGRDLRRPRRPRPAPCRSPTATRRSAAWCCRPAGCAAGSAAATRSCSRDLVRQAATAARTSQLADELQESRERLVVAREEERRRIRRDLHDGLGPSLSGVVFQLESARLLVDKDPDAAKAHDRRAPATTCRTSSPTYAAWCTTCARPLSTTAAWSARSRQQAERLIGSGGPSVTVDGRRPRHPARGGRGRGVPDRRRGAHQRRPARRRAQRAPSGCGATTRDLLVEVADDGIGIAAGGPGRRRPGLAARARRRARRPQRGHLPDHRRHRRPRLAPARHHSEGNPS